VKGVGRRWQRGRIPPSSCAHAAGVAAQGTVGLLGCQRTPPGHAELLVNQHLRVLLLRAALNPFSTLSAVGIAPTHVQDLALGLVELCEVHTGALLQPVQVPLDAIPSPRCVDRTTQLGVIGKLAEDGLDPTAMSNKDVQQ